MSTTQFSEDQRERMERLRSRVPGTYTRDELLGFFVEASVECNGDEHQAFHYLLGRLLISDLYKRETGAA